MEIGEVLAKFNGEMRHNGAKDVDEEPIVVDASLESCTATKIEKYI